MDRLTVDPDALLNYISRTEKVRILSQASGEENYDPLDRTDRSDVCPGTALKELDDVEMYNEPTLRRRVCCAAGGRTQFYTVYYDTTNLCMVTEQWPVDCITDRAPADPNETPMPVIPPPEEEQP